MNLNSFVLRIMSFFVIHFFTLIRVKISPVEVYLFSPKNRYLFKIYHRFHQYVYFPYVYMFSIHDPFVFYVLQTYILSRIVWIISEIIKRLCFYKIITKKIFFQKKKWKRSHLNLKKKK